MNKQPHRILNDVPTDDDATSVAIKADNQFNLRVQVFGDDTDTPVGTFRLQGSDDHARVDRDELTGESTAKWVDLTLPEGSVHIDADCSSVSFTGPSRDISWDGTDPAEFAIYVTDPPARVRVLFVSGSGGASAGGLTVWGAGRT